MRHHYSILVGVAWETGWLQLHSGVNSLTLYPFPVTVANLFLGSTGLTCRTLTRLWPVLGRYTEAVWWNVCYPIRLFSRARMNV